MDEKQRVAVLEAALAQMLKPIRGIPFNVVVRALAERQIIRIEPKDPLDARLLMTLMEAIKLCGSKLKAEPIRRPRPNEVGNDVEVYVAQALLDCGLRTEKPRPSNGQAKSTGYPDLLFFDASNRPTYLECKIYSEGTRGSTMRSFYVSPSESFKVALDARHLLLAFCMDATAVEQSRDSIYCPTSFQLVDLHDLLCDVKYEFNSDNRRLYAPGMLLASGSV